MGDLLGAGLLEQVIFIKKLDNNNFQVDTKPINEGVDTGLKVIKQFVKKFDSGDIDMTSVYPRYSNEQLAEIPEVEAMMVVKGITLGS